MILVKPIIFNKKRNQCSLNQDEQRLLRKFILSGNGMEPHQEFAFNPMGPGDGADFRALFPDHFRPVLQTIFLPLRQGYLLQALQPGSLHFQLPR